MNTLATNIRQAISDERKGSDFVSALFVGLDQLSHFEQRNAIKIAKAVNCWLQTIQLLAHESDPQKERALAVEMQMLEHHVYTAMTVAGIDGTKKSILDSLI